MLTFSSTLSAYAAVALAELWNRSLTTFWQRINQLLPRYRTRPPLFSFSFAFTSSASAILRLHVFICCSCGRAHGGVDAVVSAQKEGLARSGAGLALQEGLRQGEALSSIENAVAYAARRRALPLLKSQSVLKMQRLKGDAEKGGRQLVLSPRRGRKTTEGVTTELRSGCMPHLDGATRRSTPRSWSQYTGHRSRCRMGTPMTMKDCDIHT